MRTLSYHYKVVHARTVSLSTGEVAYWQYGAADGSPVIFVHGFRGDHHGLEQIAFALLESHPELKILVPDLPGFGASPAFIDRQHSISSYAQWLQEFASVVAGERYAILSHSFGTIITAHAIANGASPQNAVLVNPISVPALSGGQRLLSLLALGYYRVGQRLPQRVGNALLSHPIGVRVMSEVMAKTEDRNLRRWIHQQHDRYFSSYASSTALLEAFEASISHTVSEVASALTLPVLVIAGEKDDLASTADQLKLVKSLTNGTLEVVLGSGHLTHYEAPAEIAEIAASFWEQQ